MAHAHPLEGLMKWLHRDEWRDAFEDLLETHVLAACKSVDLDADEAISTLGEDYFLSTVFCAAFEDFLTQKREDGRNIIDEYLKRRGWKESVSTRSYMSALRSSVISLYEVSEIVSGASFRARDLVRGGEPVLINEHLETPSMKQGDHVALRLLKIGSKVITSSLALPFDHRTSEALLRGLRKTATLARERPEELARTFHCDANDPVIKAMMTDSGLLRTASPIFTTVWLAEALNCALSQRMPAPWNADGGARRRRVAAAIE